MARYLANTRFGPWKVGDVFESTDPYYEVLAAAGHLTTLADNLFVDIFEESFGEADPLTDCPPYGQC